MITLRFVRPEDAKQILEIYGPVVCQSFISFEEVAPTELEMKTRIEKILSYYPWIVAVDQNSNILGYAYASQHRERAAYRWAVDVSAYVREGSRGLGVGKQLYEKLFDILKRQNFFRAFAGIALPNAASVRLHERMGFQHLGTYKNVGFKHGRWHDVGWWELSIKNAESHPTEPIPILAISEP